MPDTDVLDALHVRAAEKVVRYLDSFERGGPPRTRAIAEVADAVADAGARPGALGPAWVLVEAWQTAHRVLDGPYDDPAPCPCAAHTPGSRLTLGNLAALAARVRPDAAKALAMLTPNMRP